MRTSPVWSASCRVASAILALAAWTFPATAQVPAAPADQGPALAPAPRAPAPPPEYSDDTLRWIYTNQMGSFRLDLVRGRGQAQYRWFDGGVFNDRLEHVGLVNIVEPEDPSGMSRCSLWKVPGEPFRLAFGIDGYRVADRPNQVLHRLYYSWDGRTYYRWKTTSGTERSSGVAPQ